MATRYFNMNDIFYQDDNAKYYYCMDFSSDDSVTATDSITGTPIVQSEVRGNFTSDLVIEDVQTSGLYVCMFVSGGTPNKTYKVEVQAETSEGLHLEGDGFIRIGD